MGEIDIGQAAYNEVIREIEDLSVRSWIVPSIETALMRLDTIKRLAELIDRSYTALKQRAEGLTARKEYCKYSDLMPRGYYCPDPLSDIIATNYRRGRSSKKEQTLSIFGFTYYFDTDNELVMVKMGNGDEKAPHGVELLFKNNSFRIGFKRVDGMQCAEPETNIDICIECKDEAENKYSIGAYSVKKLLDDYYALPIVIVQLIDISDGVPYKLSIIDEAIDQNRAANKMLQNEISDSGYLTRTNEFEVFYDDLGRPHQYKHNGDVLKPGNAKKPIISGMI